VGIEREISRIELDTLALLNWSMMRRFCPHPQPLSQAWERGARATRRGRGEGKSCVYSPTSIIDRFSLANKISQTGQDK
jgi:hypothetical protein